MHQIGKKSKTARRKEPHTFDMDSDAGHEREEVGASDSADCSPNNPTEDIKDIKVFGRLALTGAEIQRRIEGHVL